LIQSEIEALYNDKGHELGTHKISESDTDRRV